MAKGNCEGLPGLYHVLALTNEKGFFCGKLLGGLGADVGKIEQPGGDHAHIICPRRLLEVREASLTGRIEGEDVTC